MKRPPRQKFVVVIEGPGEYDREVIGPYTSFKTAEGDAKAWENWNPRRRASVEPIKSREYRP